MNVLIILSIALSFVFIASAQTANYCLSTLCNGSKHIACNNNGAFGTSCPADKKLIDITPYVSTIVDAHNNYRNKVALGQVNGLKAAKRMPTLQWDDELKKLAEMNVKTCVFAHDACHNTDRFKYSGQNLAWNWGKPAPTVKASIDSALSGWFGENKDTTQANIDKFTSTTKTIGHFTVMVADRNTHVGCAAISYGESGGTSYITACNYATTNMLNFEIYKTGTAASGCTSGTNSQYPGLCSVNEKIDVNKFY